MGKALNVVGIEMIVVNAIQKYPDFDIFISGKYVGNRPIKLRKSKWKERTDYEALEKHKVTVSFVI